MFFPYFLFAVRRAEPAAKRWRASAIGSRPAESPLGLFENTRVFIAPDRGLVQCGHGELWSAWRRGYDELATITEL